MFPQVDESNIPNEEKEFKKARHTGKSFLYDFKKGDFVTHNGKLVEVIGIEALKVWIEKIIRTEKFRFRIYEATSDDPYGVTIEDLFSSPLPRAFIESEIKREVTASILTHSEIQSLENWRFEYKGGHTSIYFTVELIDGAFNFEVVI